ncbi:MAG: DNA primase family protein, partial [Cetobacterium sp.]
ISMSSSEIKEVKEHLRIESTIDEEKLNSHRKLNYINCQNAMLEIKEREIIVHPHSPDYFSTSCLGVSYNEDSKCQLWMDFLSETFDSYSEEKEKAIQLLQEIMGYLLIPGNGYQKFFSFYGVARSGKSLIGSIISAMLGKENVSSLPFEQLGKEGRTAELASKLLNLSSELSRGVKIDSAPIKSLVGQDKVFARKLYSSPFYFVNQAKLLTISNSLPYFNDNSSAIYERLIVLNFDKQVPADKRDSNLNMKLENELEGIFVWSIQGLISLQKRGKFEELQKGIAIKDAIQSMADSVLYWIEETSNNNVEFEYDDGNLLRISLKKFYAYYVSFCKESNIEIEKRSEFKLRISQIDQIVIFKDTNKNQDYVEITL